MQEFLERASITFTAGVVGALVASLGWWLAGRYGWTAALGVHLAPTWEATWLQPRLLLGGLWGLLFLPPLCERSVLGRGLVLSLLPSLAQLLLVFPMNPAAGPWGLGFGSWTPLCVVVAGALWGWTAAFWVLLATGGGKPHYERLR